MNTALLEESGVNKRFHRLAAVLLIALLGLSLCASAQETVKTTVVMRVSHMTQNAVVDVGEDLTIEVNIDGVNPATYQWFFNNQPIEGANQKVLNIINAQTSDSGLYRLDAFDEGGAMVVSMDISARVVDKAVPKSGDDSMSVGYAFGGMAVCGLALLILMRRRASLN